MGIFFRDCGIFFKNNYIMWVRGHVLGFWILIFGALIIFPRGMKEMWFFKKEIVECNYVIRVSGFDSTSSCSLGWGTAIRVNYLYREMASFSPSRRGTSCAASCHRHRFTFGIGWGQKEIFLYGNLFLTSRETGDFRFPVQRVFEKWTNTKAIDFRNVNTFFPSTGFIQLVIKKCFEKNWYCLIGSILDTDLAELHHELAEQPWRNHNRFMLSL